MPYSKSAPGSIRQLNHLLLATSQLSCQWDKRHVPGVIPAVRAGPSPTRAVEVFVDPNAGSEFRTGRHAQAAFFGNRVLVGVLGDTSDAITLPLFGKCCLAHADQLGGLGSVAVSPAQGFKHVGTFCLL
jgi:hypothetical protein